MVALHQLKHTLFGGYLTKKLKHMKLSGQINREKALGQEIAALFLDIKGSGRRLNGDSFSDCLASLVKDGFIRESSEEIFEHALTHIDYMELQQVQNIMGAEVQ